MLQISSCDLVALCPGTRLDLSELPDPSGAARSRRGAARGQETPDPPGGTFLSFAVCTVSPIKQWGVEAGGWLR